mmetsp:Transcript_5080/g.10713  ORF Transcript_5080/g.10713 Transcript_5080/m.10713 type:complete len:119 (+) Transcript_5080:130-486(+)
MPPQKKKAKAKRIPHANETPLKHKAPGHGAVERSKNSMWTSSSSQMLSVAGGDAAGAPKKYTAAPVATLKFGRGGGGSRKKSAATAVTVNNGSSSKAGVAGVAAKANPDSDFFPKQAI